MIGRMAYVLQSMHSKAHLPLWSRMGRVGAIGSQRI